MFTTIAVEKLKPEKIHKCDDLLFAKLSSESKVQNATGPSFDHIMIILVHLISGNMFKYQT